MPNLTLDEWLRRLEELGRAIEVRWPGWTARARGTRMDVAPGDLWSSLSISCSVGVDAHYKMDGSLMPVVHGTVSSMSGTPGMLSEFARLATELAQILCFSEAETHGLVVWVEGPPCDTCSGRGTVSKGGPACKTCEGAGKRS